MLQILTFLCFYLCTTYCYNIDTYFPIVYAGVNNKALFGYSVQLRPEKNSADSWLQVGAPRERASYNESKVTGVIYRCLINGDCQPLAGDHNETDGEASGASMDFQKRSNISITCSPRRLLEEDDMGGSCIWRGTEKYRYISRTLEPFKNKHYNYHNSSLAGFSVHLVEDRSQNPQIVIGAPGATNGRGAIAMSKGKGTTFNIVADPSTSDTTFTYFGYAVNSGKFLGASKIVFYVASAPQHGINDSKFNSLGQVVVFTLYHELIKIRGRLEGTQLGEYFGSSLAVADVTGDGKADLIVGAPTWSKEEDEGRIYVFVGNSAKEILTPAKEGAIIQGLAKGARFGSVVQALGDLDHDAYEDIAVGAPYEDNRGAIYIYYGTNNGLTNDRKKKITASEFDPILNGFGVSISRGQDIDGNGYNDVAVGSFISGHVLLLRGRPVVDVKLTFINNTNSLNQTDKYLNLTSCITISNKYKQPRGKPPLLILDTHWKRTIVADETLNRITNNSLEFERSINLTEGQEHCEFMGFIVRNLTLNLSDAIEITVSYELIDYIDHTDKRWIQFRGSTHSTVPKNDDFEPLYPVTYSSRYSHTLTVPFVIDCGDDHICRSDLRLTDVQLVGIQNNIWVYGSNQPISLHIEAENFGDNAYLAKFEVQIPYPVYLRSSNGACHPFDNGTDISMTRYECNLGNSFKRGLKKNIIIDLDMTNVQSINVKQEEILEFVVNISTKSLNNNTLSSKSILLQLKTEVDIGISGENHHEFYEENEDKETSNIIDFQQNFQIQKLGSSPVEVVELKILLPMNFTKANGLNNQFLHVKSFGGHLQCTAGDSNTSENASSVVETNNDTDATDDSNKDSELRRKRQTDQIELQQAPEALTAPLDNRTFYLNCSNAQCYEIICTSSLKSNTAKLFLQMSLNMSIIKPLLKNKNVIFFSSEASVKIISPLIKQTAAIGTELLPDNVIVSTLFALKQKAVVVEKWIIYAAAAGGIFLLLLLVVILYLVGFFKRNRVPIDSTNFEETVQLRSKNTEDYTEDENMQEIDLRKEVKDDESMDEDQAKNEDNKQEET